MTLIRLFPLFSLTLTCSFFKSAIPLSKKLQAARPFTPLITWVRLLSSMLTFVQTSTIEISHTHLFG